MEDKFQKLCNKRSDIHYKIRKIIRERLEIVERRKSVFSISDHEDKLYAELVCLFEKDNELKMKQHNLRKQKHLSTLSKDKGV